MRGWAEEGGRKSEGQESGCVVLFVGAGVNKIDGRCDVDTHTHTARLNVCVWRQQHKKAANLSPPPLLLLSWWWAKV